MFNFSISEENYIKSIYHLQNENGDKAVSTNELASRIKTTAASATDMLKKLRNKKLIIYKAYYGCNLTETGMAAALYIIRRHRLWEFFLVDKLGFDWAEVHEIAENLEHVNSVKLTDKLDAFLGFPRFDPHGDPIPDAGGVLLATKSRYLNELGENEAARVSGVKNQSSEILDLLKFKKIKPGTTISVEKKYPFDGSLEIRIGKKTGNYISRELAKEIVVEKNG